MNREIESNELKNVIGRLIARADNAYCDYISTQRTDECLGWEVKVENNKFGIKELEAHKKASEHLGRHRALHEAAKMFSELLEEK